MFDLIGTELPAFHRDIESVFSPVQESSVFQHPHIVGIIVSVLQRDVLKGFRKERIALYKNVSVVIDPYRHAVTHFSQGTHSVLFQIPDIFIQRIHGDEIALGRPVNINDPAVGVFSFYDLRLVKVQDCSAKIHQFQTGIHIGRTQTEIRRGHDPGDRKIPEHLQLADDLLRVLSPQIHIGNCRSHALNKV